jgi:type I restriction enzyme S subunit
MSTATTHIETEKQLVPALRFKNFNGQWDGALLKDLSERVMVGLATSVTDYYTDETTGAVPIIRNQNIKNGYFDDSSMLYLKQSFSELHPNKRVKGNDVITVHTGSNVGLTCVVPENYDGAQTFTTLVVTLKKELLNPFFLNYILGSPYGAHQALRLVVGGGKGNLNTGDFKIYPVNFPTLPEQQKIASFLSAVDEKIQQLTKKKALLEQYKKGVMQQLFSGQLRFKDENGNPYPDWEEKRLGEVCSNISYGMNAAATTYDGQNKYLRITDIDESSNGLNVDKLTSPNGTLEDKFRVKEGDLLFARTGASVGKSYLYRISDGILYFAGFLIRFHVKDAVPAFIYLQTQTSKYDKWVKVMSMRSGQPGINAEEYKTFEIPFPCEEEQQKIATYLSRIDTKIEAINNQITQTQTFKKGLLQQMFV